ncbi:aromatic-ring-hydroxylating dioxygenase subunit beta [uncultured Pigmentiphaga sp.]|jgi:Small subunit of phenylpropionate dioxygenase|uniref:aromatic-ring-hydroxylating dioxygenase subunit beta n=1 Tax=uncultured Pigmentiphaga sp. TaxID=340361 RepID=UPI00260644FF|nr:aromatic-ring-hydroxylating dioxygenase subunit beta [uncultured Pigmentiphaga sp.]
MSDLRTRIEALLYHEVELLDTARLEEWLTLFTPDGLYWVPIDDRQPHEASASIIYDDTISREERVYRFLHLTFPAQTPRSRTLHFVNNIRIDEPSLDGLVNVRTNQLIVEMRGGDSSQVGLGKVSTHAAAVHYVLRQDGDKLGIKEKKVLLINRDMPLGNLTFFL